MRKFKQPVPACLYILADHLDAILAAGEDLVHAASYWPQNTTFEPATAGARRWALTRLHTHELSLITHVLRARECAKGLAREKTAFRPSAHLFHSGLHAFEEIAGDHDRAPAKGFDGGTDLVGFLRERGLIAIDAAGALPIDTLKIDDTYLIAGKMPLGLVLDLVSEFLEALDIHYDLYPDAKTGPDRPDGVERAA